VRKMLNMEKRYKITYEEKTIKTSIVTAEGEADAHTKWDNNEDTERETISGYRYIKKIIKEV